MLISFSFFEFNLKNKSGKVTKPTVCAKPYTDVEFCPHHSKRLINKSLSCFSSG
ncbi:MAG: hypothetical protein VW380_02410 [Candidatus Woesearchaeota archaeon]